MICYWFEPVRGGLFSRAIFQRLPHLVQTVLRWWAAIFLVIWFIFGIIVWPLFVLFL
jgi:hypothetical protein